MLATRDRKLLLEVLRPPPGYQIDRAVGTSFSLDLMALLATPLAFTFFDWEREDGGITADPVALLQALRRHASRIHLFCQAGRIRVPRPDQRLLAYLEQTVIETQARTPAGIFHPKAWVLRYRADDAPIRYRLLCLSRNLTFERSWDTALVLDGELAAGSEGSNRNEGLLRFLEALPRLTLRPLEARVREEIDRMVTEIPRVAFEAPEGFDSLAFHALGIDYADSWPFPELERPMAIVAPFVSQPLLERLQRQFRIEALVSLPESLAAVVPEVRERCNPYVLTDGTDLDSRSADEPEQSGGIEGEPTERVAEDELSGLHAKLYIMDDGATARIWTGSANATQAAFGPNVELMVELRGKKTVCGIEAFLGSEATRDSFGSILQPYESDEHDPIDPVEEALRRSLDRARLVLARAGYRFRAVQEGEEEVGLVLTCDPGVAGELPTGMSVVAWPSTLNQDAALEPPMEEGASLRFGPLSMEALTSFCAFEVRLDEGEGWTRFLLNLPLEDVPAEREQRLLNSLLTNGSDVIRLLLLLLAEEGFDIHGLVEGTGGGTYDFGRRLGLDGSGLLEALLQALVKGPDRLDEVAWVVRGLAATEEGRKLLPEEFQEIWGPIWAARQEGVE